MFYLVASRSTSGKHVPWINSFTSTITDACLDHQQLSQRLHVYGLYEVRISGDGNCQFYAISGELYMSSKHVQKVVVKQACTLYFRH
ncbi:OTU domain-containing protein [Tanacetum coccineum]|uniref:OTU domain-containing protein n=1 Tax=Tanacetum coccineum TaxID=301880 RepID=A0ABQ4XB57_9ASTR